MVYVLHIRSLSVIASQMYFMHAFFFNLFFFLDFCKEKKRGRKKGAREREERAQGLENCEFIIQRTAHLSGSSWLGY